METFKKIVGVALTLLVCSSSAFAATNPPTATETSSQGTSTLSVTIPVLYRISDIDNLTTLNYSDTVTAPAIAMNDDVCIYTNDASTSDYRIRLQGSSTCSGGGGCPTTPGDQFAISNDDNDQHITYRVYWNDQTGVAGRAQVGSQGGGVTDLDDQTNAARDFECENGLNANFSVEFDREDVLDVLSGPYTGTLTITLLPRIP